MEKVAEVRKELTKEEAAALVVTALDEVACESFPMRSYFTHCSCPHSRALQPSGI